MRNSGESRNLGCPFPGQGSTITVTPSLGSRRRAHSSSSWTRSPRSRVGLGLCSGAYPGPTLGLPWGLLWAYSGPTLGLPWAYPAPTCSVGDRSESGEIAKLWERKAVHEIQTSHRRQFHCKPHSPWPQLWRKRRLYQQRVLLAATAAAAATVVIENRGGRRGW